MSDAGKSDWFAMSTLILGDPKLEVLRSRHGNDALAVLVALMCAAKLQRQGGTCEVSLRPLASDSYCSQQQARQIVTDAQEVGFLRIDHEDDLKIEVYLLAWKRWQQNYRQAKHREAVKANSQADVTSSHSDVTDESQNVTHSTRQDNTGQNNKKKPAPTDSLPKDFPPELVATVDSVRPLLQSIADARGAKPVTRLALAKVIQQYPHHAHLKIAQNLDHWLLHGGGEKKPCKDVVARYRFFLDGDKPVAAQPQTVTGSVADRMERELPDIPRGQIEMHIYRLGQLKRPVTAESIRERHEATRERTAA